MAAPTNVLAATLSKYTVADILAVGAPRAIVEIDSKTEVHAALKTLITEHILSAPVWNAADKRYEGFLDVRDLASFVVFETQALIDASAPTGSPGNPDSYIKDLLTVGARMYKQPIVGVTPTYMARRHPFASILATDSVAKLLHVMTGHAHRVVVVDPATGRGKAVVSQSNVIAFLAAHAQEAGIKEMLTVKINSPRMIGSSPVLTVHESAPVLNAFKLMSRRNTMGIAVVDDDGKFVGNTSGSDLKLFVNEPATSLQQGTMDFLCKIRQQNLKAVHPAIHVDVDATLGHVVAKLAATKIHRMYACDATGQLSQVCALSDVLKYVDWMMLE